ncbi:hypothetical protein K9M78_00920 [Candidatus Bipolaricaulota bacterium]|nr:hypothetical protein [Candidatus Bipolaricaulota bacterium]
MKDFWDMLSNCRVSDFWGILFNGLAAGGTIFLGIMAYLGLRKDSIPTLRTQVLSASSGRFRLALVNAGKVPIFVDEICIERESVGELDHTVTRMKEFDEYYGPDERMTSINSLPYPLVGGEKFELVVEIKDCEEELEDVGPQLFFGEEEFSIKTNYNSGSGNKKKSATIVYNLESPPYGN